ncbi:hypothetical protein PR048_012507 [Dryococelus australis]|uniref:Pre-C2HC domain-containing protein n=1 Tax=Dryococelus australis TaxID=614101 RepID=A0ABQ9HQD7_9NEOP|nr:hypothetical protein PR048_012507 [Dryococelus australis]
MSRSATAAILNLLDLSKSEVSQRCSHRGMMTGKEAAKSRRNCGSIPLLRCESPTLRGAQILELEAEGRNTVRNVKRCNGMEVHAIRPLQLHCLYAGQLTSRQYNHKEPSQHSSGVISENQGKPKSGWPDRESNLGPPECESSELQLRHLTRCKVTHSILARVTGVWASAGRVVAQPDCPVARLPPVLEGDFQAVGVHRNKMWHVLQLVYTTQLLGRMPRARAPSWFQTLSENGSKTDTENCCTIRVHSWTGHRDEVHFEPLKLAVGNLDARSAAIVDKVRHFANGLPTGGTAVVKWLECSHPFQVVSPPGFSHVGIVPDNAAGRRVFSVLSRFPQPCIPALLRTHLVSPSSALETSISVHREDSVPNGMRVFLLSHLVDEPYRTRRRSSIVRWHSAPARSRWKCEEALGGRAPKDGEAISSAITHCHRLPRSTPVDITAAATAASPSRGLHHIATANCIFYLHTTYRATGRFTNSVVPGTALDVQPNIPVRNRYAILREQVASTSIPGSSSQPPNVNLNLRNNAKHRKPTFRLVARDTGRYSFLVRQLRTIHPSGFTISMARNSLHIVATDLQKYEAATNMLKNTGIPYFTYSTNIDPPQKVVFDLPADTDPNNIAEELTQRGYQVTEVYQFKYRKQNDLDPSQYQLVPQNRFCVTAAKNDSLDPLISVTRLNMTIVHPRQYQRKLSDVAQCKLCQALDHTKNYCKLNVVCPHCTGSHTLDACPQIAAASKCVNCNGDHLANSKDCPKLIAIVQQRQQTALKKMQLECNRKWQRPRDISQYPKLLDAKSLPPQASYAQAARGPVRHVSIPTNATQVPPDHETLEMPTAPPRRQTTAPVPSSAPSAPGDLGSTMKDLMDLMRLLKEANFRAIMSHFRGHMIVANTHPDPQTKSMLLMEALMTFAEQMP